MAQWVKVSRCKTCGKIYSNGVPEVCRKCGTSISYRDSFLSFIGESRCMVLTENAESVIAQRKIFHRWTIKN